MKAEGPSLSRRAFGMRAWRLRTSGPGAEAPSTRRGQCMIATRERFAEIYDAYFVDIHKYFERRLGRDIALPYLPPPP